MLITTCFSPVDFDLVVVIVVRLVAEVSAYPPTSPNRPGTSTSRPLLPSSSQSSHGDGPRLSSNVAYIPVTAT